MLRGLILAGLAAVVVASCGSGSSTPTPVPSPSVETPSAAPSAAPAASPSAAVATAGTGQTMLALCSGVAVRKLPTSTAAVLVRVNTGATVHVVGTVAGDAYTAGTCGTSGSAWLKIDQLNGKKVKSLYGVTYAYAAAGFFQ
jgi:hypothetical protein